MKDLRELSGPWTGFWVKQQRRGHMRARLFFLGHGVDGDGTDLNGDFIVRGTLSEGRQNVQFFKAYQGHTVVYEGTWDGNMIHGTWMLPFEFGAGRGTFEIWPEQDAIEGSQVGETELGDLPRFD